MRKVILLYMLVSLGVVASTAQTPWLHIFMDNDFQSFKTEDIDDIHYDFWGSGAMHINLTDGTNRHLKITDIENCEIGHNVPTLYIDLTDYPEMTELAEKDTYLNCTLRIDGNGIVDDMPATSLNIKGRGNSTWGKLKKPYRLKFDKKTSICGFKKAKSYALLANYIDCTLLRNSLALKAAQLLDMPFSNHFCPVRVVLNGIPKGAYLLTEKIGISGASVDIDEDRGVLLDLSAEFDEPYKFRSPIYDLPVMVKDPDLDEIAAKTGTSADDLFEVWKNDFTAVESIVSGGGSSIWDYIDLQSVVDYFLIYNFTGCLEPNWPKSVYLYKRAADDLYHFGPVWDFDWAYTYNGSTESASARVVLMPAGSGHSATLFFRSMFATDEFRDAFAKRWQYFYTSLYPELIDFIDEYAALIRPSAKENGVLWPYEEGETRSSFDFDANVAQLKLWISQRVEYISSRANFGLF